MARFQTEWQALGAQSLVCFVVALGVLVWSAVFQEGSGWWQMIASGLGSVAIIGPSAFFAWRSQRLLAEDRVVDGVRTNASAAADQQQAAHQVLGLAAVKLVATMILMVIAYVLAGPQAQWVLVGIAAAAIGAVLAAWIVSTASRSARSRHS